MRISGTEIHQIEEGLRVGINCHQIEQAALTTSRAAEAQEQDCGWAPEHSAQVGAGVRAAGVLN